ncbi:MAG TPA: retropepsin-like aspartic protease [Candidatus Binatia bacterium]|nr:retropepsin-like aspartic protease [Candidatus Binatia bacterium]
MGLFHVRGHLTGPTGRVEEVELLVDTGATLTVVPRSLAERLELKTTRSQPVVIAGGQRDIWPIAEARLALNGDEITTPCFIAPEGPALLGAVALELSSGFASKRYFNAEARSSQRSEYSLIKISYSRLSSAISGSRVWG